MVRPSVVHAHVTSGCALVRFSYCSSLLRFVRFSVITSLVPLRRRFAENSVTDVELGGTVLCQ